MLHKTPEVPSLEACYTGPPDIVLGAVTCGTCAHSMSSLRGSKLYAGQASGAECAGALPTWDSGEYDAYIQSVTHLLCTSSEGLRLTWTQATYLASL